MYAFLTPIKYLRILNFGYKSYLIQVVWFQFDQSRLFSASRLQFPFLS
ncbi:hypothetical protein CAL7102_02063 [Dulcicalothrix desertica PCC 7102]|jgi:hypothetical protein|nr:hypothetical protein CAL7102_02063 [Dulcicalothrix desertica PCC 7102]